MKSVLNENDIFITEVLIEILKIEGVSGCVTTVQSSVWRTDMDRSIMEIGDGPIVKRPI